jgi:hypothetical protein
MFLTRYVKLSLNIILVDDWGAPAALPSKPLPDGSPSPQPVLNSDRSASMRRPVPKLRSMNGYGISPVIVFWSILYYFFFADRAPLALASI